MSTAEPTTPIVPVDYDEAIARFDPVLGIEVHVELGTDTKMFDGAPNVFAAEPNAAVTPTSLGLPGALPVVNRTAVEHAIKIGLALNCQIAESSASHASSTSTRTWPRTSRPRSTTSPS